MSAFNRDKRIPVECLHQLFRLDEETGYLFWRERGFGRSQNKPVGCLLKSGYRKVGLRIDGHYVQFYAHHIVWAIVTGAWPQLPIDHKNQNKDDNRFGNLREATYAENRVNSGANKRSASGLKWVSLHKASVEAGKKKVWQASVWFGKDRKQKYFECSREAHEWAASVAEKLHGEFYNPG